MIRSFSLAVAFVALAAMPAFAGGGGGGGSKSNYIVRVKNNGAVSEAVSVTQGATASLVGSKTLAANQVGQWSIKKGAYTVGAYDLAGVQLGEGAFNTQNVKNQYVLAAISPGGSPEATVVGSPNRF